MHAWKHESMNECTDWWMNACMDEYMNAWMNVCMDESNWNESNWNESSWSESEERNRMMKVKATITCVLQQSTQNAKTQAIGTDAACDLIADEHIASIIKSLISNRINWRKVITTQDWKHNKPMENWHYKEGLYRPLLCRYLDLHQKQKSWSARNTKWRREIKISKRKCVVIKEKQWWGAASINIIMEWNHNIIIYQCWNWSNWEELVSRNAMWCAITQWSTSAESQVMAAKWSQVKSFSQSQKIDKEGLSTRKVKNRNIVNDINIARLWWKSTRRKFS